MGSVNFTLNEISDYSRKLEDAYYKAEQLYTTSEERAVQLCAYLDEVISVGENNVTACESEIEACDSEKNVAEQKISALENAMRHIEERIRCEEQLIAQIEAQRLAYAHQAEAINSRPCPEEQKSARDQQLAAIRRAEHACAAERSKHNEKVYRLRRIREELGGYIANLREVLSSLNLISSHLEQERQRILAAINRAEHLKNNINDYMDRLTRAREKRIHGELLRCSSAAQKAYQCADAAHDRMCDLNDRGYTSYDRIEVGNIGALRSSAANVKDTLGRVESGFREMKNTCQRKGEIMQGRLMSATLAVMDTLSEQEKHSFAYIYEKAVKLEEFCKSLDDYYRCRM